MEVLPNLESSKEVTEISYNDLNRCHDCGGTEFVKDYSRGELICPNCGLIIEDVVIDLAPEWRAFTNEEKKKRSRSGDPISPLKSDLGMSTTIGLNIKDAYGKKLSISTQQKMKKLRWINDKSHRSVNRNLSKALKELKRIASQLSLPISISKGAAIIYRKALARKLIRGRSIDGMVAASVYIACRMNNIPQTLREIARVSRSRKKEIAHCYRVIIRSLNLKLSPSEPTHLIPRIINELNLSIEVQKRATEILNKAKEMQIITGKNPMSLTAAAIYIAGIELGERRTQQEIAKVAQTTEVTLRNRYKELVKVLGLNPLSKT